MVQQFIDSIIDGRMEPGKKLVSEVQLAADFQISRNILREAMKTMEVLGIIEIGHGRGTYISKFAKQRIANVDFIRSLACNQTVNDLLETRIVIEPGLAEFAAQRRTPDDIEQLLANVGNMVRNYEDEHRNSGIFHQVVARTSRCTVLANYLDSIFKQLQYSDYGTFAGTFMEKHIKQEITEHQKIVECIIDHDGKGAKNLMYVHLVNRYNMIQAFQSKG
ncbi:MAG: FCD domain-containing protein [Candidatus Pelethousia sp.]|nr:FCD domain-containing protein [Candidatus Pelethousia sp.]